GSVTPTGASCFLRCLPGVRCAHPWLPSVAPPGLRSKNTSTATLCILHPRFFPCRGCPMPISTRREFLASTAAVVPLVASARGADAKTPVVDTHLHCFAGKDDAKFPYHKDAPYTPAEAATPEHLLKCMADGGVDYAIVVHPEPYQDDHRYLEHCLAVGKGKLKGTCLFFAGREGNADKLRAPANAVPLVAGRIPAYAESPLPPFGKPELTALWKQYSEAGIAVQLHFEPKYAEGFEPLIKEFTDTPVLI